ncbi:SDR family NAD(P)-dependent oxidoreductase [Sagittula sp. S175]|uniref:SDR family NAD(P)-dependent oxidoreductase n=1 Tax=Sagittula sp. S175 TaxID=3415129 RepID=UPI003C7B22DE
MSEREAMPLPFDGKVALVTGAGSGIGAETARLLGARGARVMVTDIDGQAAGNVAAAIANAGCRAEACVLDVTDFDAVAATVARARALFGGLDLAVNNAGVATPHFALADLPHGEWHRQIGVNLTGVFNCMKAEIPAMLERGGGSVVNVSSIFGRVGSGQRAGYVAAKHGVIGLTKAAALDYAEQRIRVNAVAPGYVETPLLSERTPEQLAALAQRHPVNRLGLAHEVAEAVLFLLSDAALFMTGSVVDVDGGYTAR